MNIKEAIKQKEMKNLPTIERTTMTVKEMAVYLDLSTDFVYKLCREKKIPHIKIGTRTMFKKESIDKWLSDLERESCQY
ncbi:helix-turn-helix domain-containing protein [Virgibacillus dokdonensis]|uniref:helix-turn-helix domain-containing protein n=1 Tax=Virgibacillus dokdonensis TaxID=302167 RepID=UPI0020C9B06D|nr:helix-turn-helix domain-containing protein [Virgibacillus dokdonensis]